MRWEYKVIPMDEYDNIWYNQTTDNVGRQLNQIGLDGWELVNVVPLIGKNEGNNQRLYFKRKKGWF